MRVSVVVCTHDPERFPDLMEAVESLIGQTYAKLEVVLVVDGDAALCERVQTAWSDNPTIEVVCTDAPRGVHASRNRGVEAASGDVVAFMDDDAVAHTEWVDRLVEAYRDYDAVAVGGRVVSDWLGGLPWYLPPEFEWLVGGSYPGVAARGEEVRHTVASNLSVRRDVHREVGGLGADGEAHGHAAGAAFGRRVHEATGRGVVYEPAAVVRHKVADARTRFPALVERALEEGRTTRRMRRRSGGGTGRGRSYLWWVVRERVPRHARELIRSPSRRGLGQFVALGVFTTLVAFGYAQELIGEANPEDRAHAADEPTGTDTTHDGAAPSSNRY